MAESPKPYDFIIIGSGLGGLICGYILASEGYRILILERNNQIGGMLQVFSRDKAILDTGVHYLGSLNPGESLYRIFRYLGILDDLKLRKLDEKHVDIIRLADGSEYFIPGDMEHFRKYLHGRFPSETAAINQYFEKIVEVCSYFPLYHLQSGPPAYVEHPDLMQIKAYDYIASLTENQTLRNVLAGTNSFLYAGNRDTTPFYVHALIVNSYLNGAYRLEDGGSQIAILISRQIRNLGGRILKRKNVTGAVYAEDGRLDGVKTSDGSIYRSKYFISNLHPTVTVDLFGKENFLKVYRRRMRSLTNSLSTFTTHLVFKPHTFPYLNYNIYQYHNQDVWAGLNYDPETWPEEYFLCTPAQSNAKEYAVSMCVMAFMRFEEVAEWADSFHTVAEPGIRSERYHAFKKRKEEQIINRLENIFPGIRDKIKTVHTSTPLTYRDYTASPEGSMYGIAKSANNPLRTMIGVRTNLPNLFLTGQNVFMHGILGVALGSISTCATIIDKDKLIRKIAENQTF